MHINPSSIVAITKDEVNNTTLLDVDMGSYISVAVKETPDEILELIAAGKDCGSLFDV